MNKAVTLTALLLAFAGQAATAQDVVREDFFVESEPAISLFVRELKLGMLSDRDPTPVLLLHGARVPGVASFDLRVPNGSLAAELARAGYPVYIMNARGYGRSTRPPAMSDPADANPPLVRSPAVVHDIAVVVDWIRARRSADHVSLPLTKL